MSGEITPGDLVIVVSKHCWRAPPEHIGKIGQVDIFIHNPLECIFCRERAHGPFVGVQVNGKKMCFRLSEVRRIPPLPKEETQETSTPLEVV